VALRELTIRLHARAGELAGVAEASVAIEASASCADVKRELALRHPPIAALVRVCALATDREFLADSAPVGEATRFHLVPPVSGG
jgi:hypothetical protein